MRNRRTKPTNTAFDSRHEGKGVIRLNECDSHPLFHSGKLLIVVICGQLIGSVFKLPLLNFLVT
jgi:hypothetical protein